MQMDCIEPPAIIFLSSCGLMSSSGAPSGVTSLKISAANLFFYNLGLCYAAPKRWATTGGTWDNGTVGYDIQRYGEGE